jgi:2',3'-cyclic-nucleotide 2'-phosphodiesterase (5'-nucleotidase family)
VVDEAGRTIGGKPWLIKEGGGIRVGIIGEMLGDLVPDEVPREAAGPYHVVPVLESVKKYAAELRDKTDLIVVLGHIHDKEEVAEILKQIPGVSVVVAGHAHTAYPEMMKTEGRVAVLVNAYADQLGRLDLTVDLAGKKLQSAEWKKIPVVASLEPAADVDALVKKWEGRVKGVVDVPIGESEKELHRTDSALRKLLEKAIAEETHTDIVWINAGGIRDNLPKGRVMARDVWNMLPFDNRLVTGKFLGKELPKPITDRYPVEPDKEYTVGVPDFVAQNAAGQLKDPDMRFPKRGPLLRDAVIAWIRKKKTVDVTAAPVGTPAGSSQGEYRRLHASLAGAPSRADEKIWIERTMLLNEKIG